MNTKIEKFIRIVKLFKLRNSLYKISRELCIPLTEDVTLSLKHFISNINKYNTIYILYQYRLPVSERVDDCVTLIAKEVKNIGLDINVQLNKTCNYKHTKIYITTRGGRRWDL